MSYSVGLNIIYRTFRICNELVEGVMSVSIFESLAPVAHGLAAILNKTGL